MKRIVRFGFSLFLLYTFIFPNQGQASPSVKSGALTPPPPVLIQPFTFFDPNFSYLERGGSYIAEIANGNLDIWGDTSATVRVDKIGVELTLQRWTGTSWIDVISGSPGISTNSAYMYQSHILSSVARGYYYRTKSFHWIIEGAAYESGTRYSGTLLLSL
ncbi:hypothetical protein QWJ34_11395 [Saccharibacillus sp. CPCC 101409]|uniref:hypothetical protein n=1 Tax=Saccharibacillus sp. CPCC 101409 TaxID=3058041 RepID=UPI002671DDBE|nr:hypothetical protein [Saccharibacillus sp. CPCC 101409]MDO3410368.1 hypothetical protein [Saccharibacillus sp. CPCC 101409]